MSDKPGFSDVQPAKHPIRLIYCSNCGQKQDRSNQKYCSNCGSSFYLERNPIHNEEIETPDQYDEGRENVHSSNLNSIGGWLILPYIGFYFFALYGIAAIFTIPRSTFDSSSTKVFLEIIAILMVVFSTSCIAYIHKRSKDLIPSVIILYTLNFIVSIDISIDSHNPGIAIGALLGAIIWTNYFLTSKRVKILLKRD